MDRSAVLGQTLLNLVVVGYHSRDMIIGRKTNSHVYAA